MRTEGKYNIGYDEVKRFGDLSNNKSSSYSPDMSSMLEGIFSDGKMDFGKLMMFQLANSNPLFAAAFMKKMQPKDGGNEKKSEDTKIGFRGIEHKDNEYINDLGIVSDVKPNHVKPLDRSERKSIEKTGDFSASKDTIAIYDKKGNNITENNSDLIKEDGSIDLKKAEEKHKTLEETTKNNLTTEGINKLLDAKSPVKLDSSNYAEYGIDVTPSSSEDTPGPVVDELTEKGKKQIEILQKQGILSADTFNINDEAKTKLKEQLNQNNERDNLKDISERKNVYVKTKDDAAGDTYSAADVNSDGKITGIKKDKEGKSIDKTIAHKEGVIADKKIKLGSLDDENIKKITNVKKDGSIEIDLSKLTPDQYKTLQTEGIDYNNAAPLTITDDTGNSIPIRLSGDANIVNLKGKANATITVAGDKDDDKKGRELQINLDNGAGISDIQGAKLEHLVVKGEGTINTDLSNLTNLQAVKIEKATLANGLKVVNEKDVSLAMSDVKTDKDIKVEAKGNTDVKIANSQTGNVLVGGENVVTTLSHTNSKDVEIDAQKEASLRAYKGSKAGTVTGKAENMSVTYNGMTAENTDLTKVTDKTQMFVSKDSKVGDLNINQDAELVGEDEKTAKSLADKADNIEKVKKLGTEEGDLSTSDLFKKYFDFNDDDMARYKLDVAQSRYNAQPYGWGATPNANGRGGSNLFTNFFNGWALGQQTYNQMYGNPYAGFGQQYRQQPYNPWMAQGGYFV